MSVALNQSACPVVRQPSSILSISGAGSGGGNSLVSKRTAAGDSAFRTNALNPNATIIDRIASEGGANVYALSADNPPTLSTGASLNLAVSAGEAMIGGPVQYGGGTVVVANNTAVVWIWLKQDGTLVAVSTSTTPPAGECVLLGSCTTSGGVVTAVDTSGVCYLRGGYLWRESADTGIPGDTPPASVCLLQKTTGGDWLWDGSRYVVLPDILAAGADTIPSGATCYVRSGFQVNLSGPFTNSGAVTINGKVTVN